MPRGKWGQGPPLATTGVWGTPPLGTTVMPTGVRVGPHPWNCLGGYNLISSSTEGEHPLVARMLSGCQQAANKLSREKIFFAQTHFLELTNQNTNIHTEIPKNKNRRIFSSGCLC